MNWFFIPKIIETVKAVRSNYDIISNILPSKKEYSEEQLEQIKLLRNSLLRQLRDQRKLNQSIDNTSTLLFIVTTATLLIFGIFGYDTQTIARNIAFVFLTITLIVHLFIVYTPNFKQSGRLKTAIDDTSYYTSLYEEINNIERACKENDILLNEKGKFLRWSTTVLVLGIISISMSFVV